MATSIYLSNPVVTVNGVSLTDQCTAASFLQRYDQLEDTAFGTGSRTYTSGLGNHELTLTLYMSYAATETYATLKDLVGTTTTVIVKPTSAADSATNPGFTLTQTFLAELPVINASLGELSSIHRMGTHRKQESDGRSRDRRFRHGVLGVLHVETVRPTCQGTYLEGMAGGTSRHGNRRCRPDRSKPYGRGSFRRQLAEVLAATGFWPHDIPFDTRDLVTVLRVLNEANKKR